MAFAPALEPVALTNTSMKGNPVGEFTASFSFPKQNKVAITIARPRKPFRATDASMLLGTTVDAVSISSAVCGEKSGVCFRHGRFVRTLTDPYVTKRQLLDTVSLRMVLRGRFMGRYL